MQLRNVDTERHKWWPDDRLLPRDGLGLALQALAQLLLVGGFAGLIWLACCSGY